MLKQNNPAARLHWHLTSLRNLGDNTRLLDAWRAILKARNDDHNVQLFKRYGQVMALPERARNALLKVPELNQELFLRWVPKAEAAFAGASLSGSVATFISLFGGPSSFDDLEFAGGAIVTRETGEDHRRSSSDKDHPGD
jgi:hypothetical protein